jgi:hypothetical protein
MGAGAASALSQSGGAVRFRLDELLDWSKPDDIGPAPVVRLPRSKRMQPGKE